MRLERYKNNPFLENMEIRQRDKILKLSILGKDNNILLNQNTGEINGTHIATYKSVDTEEFVKLFTKNIALTFDLTSAGIKAFNVLMWIIQKEALNKDMVMITQYHLDEFNLSNEKNINMKTLYRGIKELEKAQIIARHLTNSIYFINPNFVFNGDRIAFTTMIEKKVKNDQQNSLLISKSI